MTLLVSWIGVDTHGPASAYIASDSRISYHNSKYYDFGKKVFASKKYPDIFAYAGEVLFPSTVLSQLIEMIDYDLLFNTSLSCSEKHKIVYEKLRYTFEKYPRRYRGSAIQIIHISRDTFCEGYPNFYCYKTTWDKKDGWQDDECDMPTESDTLFVLGSGSRDFYRNYERYQSGPNKSTSRNVFHCFIDTLRNANGSQYGGAPQLVGIYRKNLSPAKSFGIIYNDRRFFLGLEIPRDSFCNGIEWRNSLFELCDGLTKKKLESAPKQNDPLRRRH